MVVIRQEIVFISIIPGQSILLLLKRFLSRTGLTQVSLALFGLYNNFEVYLPKIIMEILSCFDVADNQAEFGYHLFMIGLLSQIQFRGYRLMSNKEEGLGRFDLKIEPVGNNVEFETSIIMEFKVLK